MSDCDKFKMQISSYLDGELPLAQRKELDVHLSVCSSCSEVLRQMKIIQQSLKQLPQIKTSPDFERKLHEQIFQSSPKFSFIPQQFQNWKLPVMGSALVFVTIALFVFLNGPSQNETQTTPNFTPAATQISNELPMKPPINISNPVQNITSERFDDSLMADSTNSFTNPEGLQLINK